MSNIMSFVPIIGKQQEVFVFMMSKRISWIAIFVICCCTWRASVAATTAKGYGMVTNPVLNKGQN